MKSILLDTLGNLLMFGTVWLISAKTVKRKYFPVRTIICLVVFCGARYLYFNVIGAAIPREYYFWSNITGFVLLMALLAVASAVCFRCDGWAATFLAATGYCFQHICHRLLLIFQRLLLTRDSHWIFQLLIYAVCAAIMLGVLFVCLKRMNIERIVVNYQLIVITAVVVIAFTIVISLKITGGLRRASDEFWYTIRISEVITTTLNVLFLFGILLRRRTEIENDTIKKLLEESQKQYEFEKQLIETINVRVHDMKHMAASLDEKSKAQLAEQMKPIAEAYDSSFHTGNMALDVILTRHCYRCREKDIEMTFFGDGKLFDFMTEADVYSLFGNILENAVEASEKLEDKKKRVIVIVVENFNHIVHVHTENFFEGNPIVVNGVFKTTKQGNDLHGYGLKSVKMITDKYAGDLKIAHKGGRFVVDILFDNCVKPTSA